MRTGQLILHGRERVSWTRLAQNVHAGNVTIVVEEDTDWEVGDHIVISSTEFNQFEAEEVYIESVSEDGRTITLTKPLLYAHWGEGWTSEDGLSTMDSYRASVGLLTRNIVIQVRH